MTRTARLLACVLLTGVLATACSAGADQTSSVAAVGGAAPAPAGADASGTASPGRATGATSARHVLTAGVVVAVDDLAGAAQQVREVAARAQGSIGSEEVDLTGATSGRARAVLVLRVPPGPLDDTLAQVAAVGTEVSRTRTAQDVEGALTDVASRISSQSASVQRVRALMGSATSLADVVALEEALTSRTADLEALQAQQADVQGRVDLATLTVELRRTSVVAAAEPHRTGFLGGLQTGWSALTTAVGTGLTVLGALLPFVLVVVVLGVPLAWVLRRRVRAVAVPPEE
jgi:hypothetical protein